MGIGKFGFESAIIICKDAGRELVGRHEESFSVSSKFEWRYDGFVLHERFGCELPGAGTLDDGGHVKYLQARPTHGGLSRSMRPTLKECSMSRR
jgi:hypothetical protein